MTAHLTCRCSSSGLVIICSQSMCTDPPSPVAADLAEIMNMGPTSLCSGKTPMSCELYGSRHKRGDRQIDRKRPRLVVYFSLYRELGRRHVSEYQTSSASVDTARYLLQVVLGTTAITSGSCCGKHRAIPSNQSQSVLMPLVSN